jgi:hypothetical protein
VVGSVAITQATQEKNVTRDNTAMTQIERRDDVPPYRPSGGEVGDVMAPFGTLYLGYAKWRRSEHRIDTRRRD